MIMEMVSQTETYPLLSDGLMPLIPPNAGNSTV